MNRLRAALRRTAHLLLPWPARHERKAAIGAARARKERSQAGAARARVITRDIERMAAENHFAQAITEDIIARHREGHA